MSWEEVGMFPFYHVRSYVYTLQFTSWARTFHVLSYLACIISRCRCMYYRSSAGGSLRSCDISVSFGEPFHILEDFNFILQLVVLRCVGLVPISFCNRSGFLDRQMILSIWMDQYGLFDGKTIEEGFRLWLSHPIFDPAENSSQYNMDYTLILGKYISFSFRVAT